MNKDIQSKIESAFDKAMLDFQANEHSIFTNEIDRLKYQYSTINELKKWKKRQKCIVERCKNKSIEKSHTIQKSGSIKTISEDSHVLTPNFNKDNGILNLLLIGINEASTFPGYCSEHERLFEDFENKKDILTGEHFGLQLYRTVCREIVKNVNNVKTIQLLIKKYKDFRNQKVHEGIVDILGDEFLKNNSISVKSIDFQYQDKLLTISDAKLKKTNRYLNDFLNPFHEAILNDLNKHKFQKIAYNAIVYDRQIPVALAGSGNFSIKKSTKSKHVQVIINVIPLESKIYIFIATFKKNSIELTKYMAQSGLYKNISFVVVPPNNGRPVMVDDTCYSIPCQSQGEAELLFNLLSSDASLGFINSLIFTDSKRPITIDVLRRISIVQLAQELGNLHELQKFITMDLKKGAESQLLLLMEPKKKYQTNSRR
jgi:hypothetical protein